MAAKGNARSGRERGTGLQSGTASDFRGGHGMTPETDRWAVLEVYRQDTAMSKTILFAAEGGDGGAGECGLTPENFKLSTRGRAARLRGSGRKVEHVSH